METTIDASDRVVLPQAVRDARGLTPGTTVNISVYGGGVQITPGGRTAGRRRYEALGIDLQIISSERPRIPPCRDARPPRGVRWCHGGYAGATTRRPRAVAAAAIRSS